MTYAVHNRIISGTRFFLTYANHRLSWTVWKNHKCLSSAWKWKQHLSFPTFLSGVMWMKNDSVNHLWLCSISAFLLLLGFSVDRWVLLHLRTAGRFTAQLRTLKVVVSAQWLLLSKPSAPEMLEPNSWEPCWRRYRTHGLDVTAPPSSSLCFIAALLVFIFTLLSSSENQNFIIKTKKQNRMQNASKTFPLSISSTSCSHHMVKPLATLQGQGLGVKVNPAISEVDSLDLTLFVFSGLTCVTVGGTSHWGSEATSLLCIFGWIKGCHLLAKKAKKRSSWCDTAKSLFRFDHFRIIHGALKCF